MNIIEKTYKWNGALTRRNATKYILLHHRAGTGDVGSIHTQHLSQGWTGIGYHFYVRKDGSVYRGRPVETVGAHCTNHNSYSVGVCFEGNFEKEQMSDVQVKAGREIVSYLLDLYPNAQVKKHSDFQTTACPGKNFPYDKITKGETSMSVDEAVKIIIKKAGLQENTIEFLLCYKYGEDLMLKLAKAMS